jgi:exo-beta-1,3-glucanase (GH17 family)
MLELGLKYFLVGLIAIILNSCSFRNENTHSTQAAKTKTAAQILGDSNYLAICYGGYRTNTRDTVPSLAQVKDDLKLMHAMGIKILRTYNTKLTEIDTLLKAITSLKEEQKSFEMYVMLGAWIDCANAWSLAEPNHTQENLEANTAEIARAVQLANEYADIVKIISVGNEAMVKWATSYYVEPKIILKWVKHLQDLKATGALPKELWISSSDNFASWGGGDSLYHLEDLKKLYQAVDYVSIHTYPMHDTHYNPVFWGVKPNETTFTKEVMIDSLMLRSLYYAKNQYLSVVKYMQSLGIDKPVHIGETGWASQSDGLYGKEGSVACDEYKSGKYYQLIREWTNKEKITCFYFEAFDEKWKDAKNPMGSENHFGLFTIDGKAKYALWKRVDEGLFKQLSREGKPIEKTYSGSKEDLLKTVALPKHVKN